MSFIDEGNKKKTRKMTRELILSGTSFPRNRDETAEHYLERITHLHLQSKKIRHIEGLEHCGNVQVLYLYDNYIEVIENISPLKSLKSLFISNNFITSIPQLQNVHLEKLRIDDNEIEAVTGLVECPSLQELSIANQRIPGSLQFDFDSLRAISQSLKYLDISGNNIPSLSPLMCLESLEHLICSNNRISRLEDLEPLSYFRFMVELNLKENPVCKLYRYQDTVIGNAGDKLRKLDEMPLTARNIDSMRAVQVHRKKVEQLKIRKVLDGEYTEDGGLDARRTLEDTNDYLEGGDDRGEWVGLHT